MINSIIKSKFIKKYWFNIVQSENGFYIFNTQRKRKLSDRDGIGYIVPDSECSSLAEAIKFLEDYERIGMMDES